MGRIQQTRYDELLRRTTAQYGGGSKVGEALEDLFPTLDVESLPMELMRATKWKFGMGRHNFVAAVGTTPAAQLFNPVGSGKLVVITSIIFTAGASFDLQFGPAFTALTDVSVAGAERDTRAGVIAPTVALLQDQDNGAASAFGIIRANSQEPFEISDPNGIAVLSPGTAFRFTTATTAQQFRLSWMWRERVALPEELNF